MENKLQNNNLCQAKQADRTPSATDRSAANGTAIFPPEIGNSVFSSLREDQFHPIATPKKLPARFYCLKELPDTPFPDLNGTLPQKARYWSADYAVRSIGYSISDVTSKSYMDTYTLTGPDGERIYDGYYKAEGTYRFKARKTYVNDNALLRCLYNDSYFITNCNYSPRNPSFSIANNLILNACQQFHIRVMNIFQDGYHVYYCFHATGYAYIKLICNLWGYLFLVCPYSTLGADDYALQGLMEYIRK